MIYQIFKESAEKYPDHIAVVTHEGKALTYGDVERKVRQLAEQLRLQSIRENDRVTVLLEDEDYHLFIYLALDLLGAVYTPFDVNSPKKKVHYAVDPLNANKIIIDDPSILDAFELKAFQSKIQVIKLEPLYEGANDKQALFDGQPPYASERNEYILPSSGTTTSSDIIKFITAGKGVRAWAETFKDAFEQSPIKRFLVTCGPGFDARIGEYINALSQGAEIHFLNRMDRQSLESIISYCELQNNKDEPIDCILLIASQVKDKKAEPYIKRLAEAQLKHLIVTGDALTPTLKEFCELYNILLWNGYGPTEATLGSSILCVNGLPMLQDSLGNVIAPIGPARSPVEMVVHNETLHIVSPYLGEYITPGYPGAEFLKISGKRAFDTGDLMTQESWVYKFLGRKKLCKISGVLVSSQEIENYIQAFDPSIEVAVVIKEFRGEERAVAYLKSENAINKKLFQEYLDRRLSHEEQPIIFEVDEIPKLELNRKIAPDVKLLRERNDDESKLFFASDEAEDVAILDDTTRKIKEIWCELFDMEISSQDITFTQLGGTSIQAQIMVSLIKEKVAPDYHMKDFLGLSNRSIRSISKNITIKEAQKCSHAYVRAVGDITPGKKNYFFLPPLFDDGDFCLDNIIHSFRQTHEADSYNIYTLTNPAVYSTELTPKSPEESTKLFVDAIKSVQKEGPYYLAGFSHGAYKCYLVDAMLKQQNEIVEEIQIIDGFPPLYLQNLSKKAFADLLRALVNFTIDILNNSFYNESLEHVKLPGYEDFAPVKQIGVFKKLSEKVKNPLSKAILALAKTNLKFMLTAPSPDISSSWVILNLSREDQPYLEGINTLGLQRTTPEYQYLFWNKYFSQITLGGKRATRASHLDLLQPLQQLEPGTQSPRLFWDRARDPLFSIRCDPWGPNLAYSMSKLNDDTTFVTFLHVDHAHFKYMLNQLSKMGLEKVDYFKHYERIHYRYERDDKLYLMRFSIIAIVPKSKLENVMNYIEKNKFQKMEIDGKSVGNKFVDKGSRLDYFRVQYGIVFGGEKIMELFFDCYGDIYRFVQAVKTASCILQVGKIKDKNHFVLGLEHHDVFNPGYFDGMRVITEKMGPFLTIIMPYVMNFYEKEHFKKEDKKVTNGCFHMRNQFIIDMCSAFVKAAKHELGSLNNAR